MPVKDLQLKNRSIFLKTISVCVFLNLKLIKNLKYIYLPL